MISSRLTNTRRDPNMLAKIRTPGKGDNCFIVQPLTYGIRPLMAGTSVPSITLVARRNWFFWLK